ncbi:hypothetical protein OUZ56_020663 [Daphnia magna]|uniref:Uncharacterized protein n=1 Tax=Daphnia magna TaxID=35525 RepID=A0ABQ9ZG67_9CRUS|nr:hypothetical protein OUZ56_020663 [Daphnia magna]
MECGQSFSRKKKCKKRIEKELILLALSENAFEHEFQSTRIEEELLLFPLQKSKLEMKIGLTSLMDG